MKSPLLNRRNLSPVDAAWLRMEDPTNLMMISGVFFFDEPLDFTALRKLIADRLLRYDRFRMRVIEPATPGMRPYWEMDPTFRIDSHIHHIALPEPGSRGELQNLVNDFMSTPLDFSKPLWQIHLIDNYGTGCALLCRLHHCIADGIALVRVLLELTDAQPDAVIDSGEQSINGDPSAALNASGPLSSLFEFPRRVERKTRERLKAFSSRDDLGLTVRTGAESSAALARLLLLGPDPATPLKGKLGVRKVCAWSNPIPLDKVKAVSRTTGGTVNDVLVAAATGALGRYLRSQGKPIGGLNIRAVVPVNLRGRDEPLTLGNAFGLVFLSLPVGIDDPLERLQELKLRMDDIKATPEAVVAYGILTGMGLSPKQVEEIVVSIFEKKATLVLTNVPGPRETRFFAGTPIQGFMFWVPQSGRLGLGISILSYAGNVMVGVAADAGLVSEPELLVNSIHDEFDMLFDLVRQVKEGASAKPAF